MFEHLPYTQVSMDSISQRAKVKKGIASMYFGSKEELFLKLASQEMDRWFGRLERRLEASEALAEPADLARLLAEQVADGSRFPRLLSLLSVVLDHNVEMDAVVPFLRGLQVRLEEGGRGLAMRCGRLAPDQGVRLLRLVLTLTAGARAFSNPIGAGAIAMADDSLAPIRSDLERDLPDLVEVVLSRG